MSGPSFTDLSKEAAVAGSIAAGTFELIPQAALIPVDAFTDPRWHVVYGAAIELRSRISAEIICAESINDHIAFHGLDRELQRAVDSTNTIEWRRWPESADTSLAFGPSTRPIEYCLHELGYLYSKRQQAQIGSQLQEGIISGEDAFEALKDILHQNNGDSLKPLQERKFDFEHPPEKPEPIFTLCGQAIATAGNLISLYSQAKTGKSAVLSAMMAAIFSPEDPLLDFLGFGAEPNVYGHAVIHFDTEQSRYDADALIRRALRRAEIEAPPPAWLRSYCLTDIEVKVRRQLLQAELEAAKKECGGIYVVLLDGVGDLAIDLNDIGESNTLLIELHAQAIKYNCPIVGVLHENPGDNKTGKTRGHLGSQLERKAESNIRLVKDSDGSTIIYTEKSRHANIPRKSGHRFKWSKSEAMHVSSEGDPKAAINYDKLLDKQFVDELFKENVGGFSWRELHERIAKVGNLKEGGARKRFAKLLKLELIEKNSAGFYLQKP